MRFSGTWVALATPFRDGVVDEGALKAIIERCLAGGVDGLVPCGTTGEGAVLSAEETRAAMDVAVATARGRVPVVAGTGSNSTERVVAATAMAREAGCDGALIVTPYYNKPTQGGLLAHYGEVARRVPSFPIVLYNVPSRTGVNLQPATVERLAELDSVVAIKEASGSLAQVQELLARVDGRMTVLSGDDALALPMYSRGAHGVISVTANLAPAEMSRLGVLSGAGERDAAAALQARLAPLFRALFLETNPMPLKAGLSLLGLARPEPRLPLVPASEATTEAVRQALATLGVEVPTPATLAA